METISLYDNLENYKSHLFCAELGLIGTDINRRIPVNFKLLNNNEKLTPPTLKIN